MTLGDPFRKGVLVFMVYLKEGLTSQKPWKAQDICIQIAHRVPAVHPGKTMLSRVVGGAGQASSGVSGSDSLLVMG